MSKRGSSRGGLIPGLIMIFVGSLFLLERVDYISTARAWDFWPMILIAIGLTHVFSPRRGRRSIFLLMVGIWLQISVLRLWGLDFGDSWPLLLIFIGLSIIFDTYLGGRQGKNDFAFHGDVGGLKNDIDAKGDEVSRMGDEIAEMGDELGGEPDDPGREDS